jgi:hypothetical protein
MSTRPPGFFAAASLAGLASLTVALAGPVTDGRAQDRPVTRLACGPYDAVPSGVSDSGHPTRLSIQKDGRLLRAVSDWRVTRVDCADINDDKTPELLVTTNSGGAHCCETLRVWSLGAALKPVLEYESGNAEGFELRDLDRDGRAELLLGDDAFAFYDDLCYACAPRNLPIVACFTDVGFQDCTARFPEILRESKARFAERLRAPGAGTDVKSVEGAALGVLAVSVLLGEEASGIETVRAAVASDEVMKWLERARPRVRDWAQGRGKRLKTGKR